MRTYDNRIKYYELLMKYDDTSNYVKYDLPSGFHFEYYKDGDINDWIDIHISSGEFVGYDEGNQIFYDFYNSFINKLNQRCIFIVEDLTQRKVGTATISLLNKKNYDYEASIDWLAIRKEYQGKHLSKALISKIVELANTLGHKRIILHTQTTTWLAAKIYLDYGFEILNKNEKEGWNILKTLTNNSKLKNYLIIKKEDIYDRRNVEIERQLVKLYGADCFNYSVWYKNGLHNVYVYILKNSATEEFEYFEKEEKIILKKVKNKRYKR